MRLAQPRTTIEVVCPACGRSFSFKKGQSGTADRAAAALALQQAGCSHTDDLFKPIALRARSPGTDPWTIY